MRKIILIGMMLLTSLALLGCNNATETTTEQTTIATTEMVRETAEEYFKRNCDDVYEDEYIDGMLYLKYVYYYIDNIKGNVDGKTCSFTFADDDGNYVGRATEFRKIDIEIDNDLKCPVIVCYCQVAMQNPYTGEWTTIEDPSIYVSSVYMDSSTFIKL